MHKECGLQFRSFVSPIVECLEDADGITRDTAKAAIIDLFKSVPPIHVSYVTNLTLLGTHPIALKPISLNS